jgi:hypothetical protein
LRLVRLRLRLALLTMAIMPMAISMALMNALLTPMEQTQSLYVLLVMVALTLLLIALTVWMSRQVLRPAEELDRSRTDLRRMYEVARADSLRDGLTGLGNHRAFQEERPRAGVVSALQGARRPTADRPGRPQAGQRFSRPRGR